MQEELKNILKSREAMYRLLGSLFQKELTAETLKELQQHPFPQNTEDAAFNERAAMLNQASAVATAADLDNLAADYAKCFLGAGIADGLVAFPIESVYTSEERLIMQDAYEEVLRILRKHDVLPSEKDLYPDHLGIELEFMGVLSAKTAEALEAEDEAKAQTLLDEQTEFLQNHLLNWTPKFFQDLSILAETPFYRALGELTWLYLQEEKAWLLG